MAVQTALDFIRQVRRDPSLRQALAAAGDDLTLDRIVEIAAAAGFRFTADELARAHAADWAMRWARYDHDHATAAS